MSINDNHIYSKLLQMEYKLNALYAASGASTGPTVDFIVDRFDRTNSSGLGPYWSTPYPWALWNNTVYSASANTVYGSGSQISGSPNFSVTGAVWPTYTLDKGVVFSPNSLAITPNQGVPNRGVATAMYSATLSSPAYTVAIDFNVPAATVTTVALTSPYTGTALAAQGTATQFGAVLGASGSYTAITGRAGFVPAMSSNVSYRDPTSGIIYTSTVSANDGGIIDCALGNLAGASLDITSGLPGISTSAPGSYSASPSGTVTGAQASYWVPQVGAGSNRLLITTDGTNVTVSLNGAQMYSGAPAYAISPQAVGLAVAALAVATSSGAGITGFKAWVSTMSEPPDQTGRGTYSATKGYLWNDRYHTGTSYNPAA